MKTTKVTLQVEGADIAECVAAITNHNSAELLSSFTTEKLLAELRDRMATQGMVVQVIPFAGRRKTGKVGAATRSATARRGRGRSRSINNASRLSTNARQSRRPNGKAA
jgi:hypothetical protein